MTSINVNADVKAKILNVLNRAIEVAAGYGPEIEAEVREAAGAPLDLASASRLYERVLVILSDLDAQNLGDDERQAALEAIRHQASDIAAASVRPEQPNVVQLVDRNGLQVRPVVPTPQFNGVIVPMMEGYVDVLTLDPWAQNERVTLHVADFVARYHREPDKQELLGILQGNINLDPDEVDPFNLRPLAGSIARKGVERPPIISADGVPHDGNRRIAASRFVVESGEFGIEEINRARWIRVWQTLPETTDDQMDAIVLSLNFEDDYKEKWPEYVKARMVAKEFRGRIDVLDKLPSANKSREIRAEVANKFAIKPAEVTRYLRMVQWSEDFTDYHVESGKAEAEVSYRTNSAFQWFYELDAGPSGSKVTERFDTDPELRGVVYDLMFDGTFDSGAQVRAMYQVANDDASYRQLMKAHQIRDLQKAEAKELITDAINSARERVRAAKSIALDQYALGIIKRLGNTPAAGWDTLDTELLKTLRGTLIAALGGVEGVLATRGDLTVEER